ncbi:PepSY domain-containing protein [Caulobacter sp. X]|uniref:PepSY-associated TM helix domain-containing protein n=1 Tax=Caulobacter sp. X TaxID=2048901 RepID=UPI000C14D498|nr:PepSY-associated TM helix domain-containing protein [Caulobacter sp. X]PIC00871.1 peptidase [Caulobacter sp. X]
MDVSADKRHAAKTKAAGKPIWPKIPAEFVRAMLAGHSALGLAFAALIYLVCFSGSIAVFTQEFERWEQPAGPVLRAVSPHAVNAAVQDAVARNPKAHDLLVRLPEPANPRLSVQADDASGREHTYVADQTGRLVREARTPWAEFQAKLHTVLHLPSTWGRFVVGLTGVALLSSLISGVLSHPRVFKDAFAFRWGGSKRLQEADLHNRISVWGLPFHLAVSLTGAFLGLTTIIVGVLALATFKGDTTKAYALFTGPTVKDDPRPAKVMDVGAALTAVTARHPDARPTYLYVQHPGERGQHVNVNVVTENRLSRGETVVVDGDGKILGEVGYEGNALGFRVLSAMTPLHFGWFGGWPVKVAYLLLGLGLTAVTSSGVAIWLARRRDKGRPTPRWERIWIAFVWSQPVAYAFSALVALLSPQAAPVAVWGLATLACCAAALVGSPAGISVALRRIGASLIALVALVHGAFHGQGMADPVGWGMDAALLATALLLAATTLARRPSAAR